MNHVYRWAWRQIVRTWVVVGEIAKGWRQGNAPAGYCGLRNIRPSDVLGMPSLTTQPEIYPKPPILIAAVLMVTSLTPAYAAPSGGQVIAGSGQIAQTGNTTTITQNSQNLSLNWQSFNVAPRETVHFIQPNAQSVAVNHILGNDGSVIAGQLTANGQVWLINPNGILFGRSATVNVEGLVASTLELSDGTPDSNIAYFSGSGTGSIVNQGQITATQGGYVALLGNTVSNQGVITARLGTVALGAGSAETLTFNGNQLVHLQVDQNTLDNLAENKGLIQADGGQVMMTAGATNSLLASVVNNTGIVQAQTVQDHNGVITLLGGMQAGTTQVGGTLDASAPDGGNGGAIDTSAAQVKIANDANVTTKSVSGSAGQWVIDPQNYTIAPTGGDITGSQLDVLLNSNNIIIDSTQGSASGSGDINVNDAIGWSGNTTLELNAYRNVNFSAAVTNSTGGSLVTHADDTGTGTGTINMLPGGSISMAGGGAVSFYYNPPSFPTPTTFSGVTVSGGTTFTAYMLVNNATNLENISSNLSGDYALGANISAGSISNFSVIGSVTQPFTGVFNGDYHTISNVTINDATPLSSSTVSDLGIFADNSGTIQNLVISNINVTGNNYWFVGGLVGQNNGNINHVAITGASAVTQTGVANNYYWGVGALAGSSGGTGPYINATHGYTQTNSATISTSSVSGTATVIGVDNSGGLVGWIGGGTVNETSSNANVKTSINSASAFGIGLGGLVGWVSGGTVENSYSTGSTDSSSLTSGSSVSQGGFVGALGGEGNGGTLQDDYSTGVATAVSGANTGGFLGSINSTNDKTTNTYWDTTTSGASTSAGSSTRLTDAQMKQQSSFSGFNFPSIWAMGTGSFLYPELQVSPTPQFYYPVTFLPSPQNKIYDGTTSVSFGSTALEGVTPNLAAVSLSGTPTGTFSSPNVGNNMSVSINLSPSGLSLSGSDAADYLMAGLYRPVTANITPRSLTAVTSANKVYDGSSTAYVGGSNTNLSGFVAGQGAVVNSKVAGVYAQANVGNNIAITGGPLTASDLTANSGTSLSNYLLPTANDGVGNITPALIQSAQSGAMAFGYTFLTSQSLIATPYGLAPISEAPNFTGNHKQIRRDSIEDNKMLSDFHSGLSLTILDGGVLLPDQRTRQ